MTLDQIMSEFSGYHVDISLTPGVGMIDIWGCAECGTDDRFHTVDFWKPMKGETVESAIEKLKLKMPKEPKQC